MSNTSINTDAFKDQPQLFGHPMGLYVLFFTEMWERFSYYGMRALLVLFLTANISDATNPGFGWTEKEALALYGTYTMLVYLASIPGGIIADKLIGQKKSVLFGGILLCIGHGVLAIEGLVPFYTGLGFIIAGVGLLKPNISTMVGGLYKQGDGRRDKGFTIFYIGINVGALLAGILVGSVAQNYGWHAGFGLAGIGMVLGQLVFMLGQKHLTGVGDFVGDNAETKALADKPLTNIEKDRIKVMLLAFLLIIIFWGAFEQAGGLMNLYAEKKTDRMLGGFEIPAAWFQSVNAFFIITLGTVVAGIWYKLKQQGKVRSSLFTMAIGVIIMGLGFLFMRFAAIEFENSGSSAMYWLVLAYLFHTVGELCASPVALSFITKLAPLKYASLMMGAYFAATGIGNKVAGTIGEYSSEAGEKFIFTAIVIVCCIAGGIVLLMLKPLIRLTHGIEDAEIKADN